jgi:thiamine-phosphate pyrophosphorylase
MPNALRAPLLIAISDVGALCAAATLERFTRVGRAARPGSVVFQLRDNALAVRERLAFGAAMASVARATNQWFVVNDRLDLAALLGADGVHLGESGVDTADARRLLGARALVSRACHEPSRVGSIDADAVLLSPILDERKGRAALGHDALGEARRSLGDRRALLVALGGVSADAARSCLEAGADGVAAIGAVLLGDPLALVRALAIER